MRWFDQHQKLKILTQIAKQEKILHRTPKIVILEFNEKEFDQLNKAIKKYVEDLGFL